MTELLFCQQVNEGNYTKAISIFDKVIWWSLSLASVSCLFFSLFIFFSEVV